MSVRTRNQNRPSGAAHGVLVVDKPSGMTSHDVVSRVRRAFGTRRVGHAGTLDPMATGVLVVLLGEATKLSSVLTTDRKAYEARVQFGVETDSLDADGAVLKKVTLTPGWLQDNALESALAEERRRRLQIPPQVSAIKVDGKRAYALARRGKHVEMPPRDVVLHEITILERGEDWISLRLTVSKGYYVRALARDLGYTLGAPAHLSALRRIQSGPFVLEGSHTLPLGGEEPLLSIGDAAERCLPCLHVNEEGAERLIQGKRLRLEDLENPPLEIPTTLCAAFRNDRLIALVERSDEGEFKVKRGVNDPFAEASDSPISADLG